MKNNDKNELGFATRAIHDGYDPATEQGALVPPVYMTSTFTFENAEQGAALFAGEEDGHFYSRISNPTLSLLELRMASLEGAEAAMATASGMGAITSTLWTILAQGDEIIVDKTLYGCTFTFFQHGLTKFGVTVKHVDMRDPENLRSAITDKTKVVYFETPANPNMRLVEIGAIAQIAKENGLITVVDNTYATPYLTRPIDLGADIVVHSATKYLGGHGDLVAGIVAGSADIITRIRLEGVKDMTGAVMAPLTAFQIMRGLKTLEIRMDRHCSSAQMIAEQLEQHPAVEKVFYPGLESFEQHGLAKRQMSKPGGMIAFELVGGISVGMRFMNELKLIKRAVSLGDVDTLIQHPASMTHSTYTPEERAEHDISDSLMRISIGLETPDDIMADLNSALDLIINSENSEDKKVA
ncbi:MAG: methionine gamma-lyase [Kordiimonadaceae bacterium]|mgnify:CR=1 FL=1|jgi:methionine-gamma-lyase|nr:methionine gamma-lyase [Kordiimonadaceae bacterium]MBT6037590.1 methionine gamma-lyase [Kordiimonadaceae bacterium]MBT6330617.1 methionine gamma-lyase [Kordiimonadaceae bacterium]MBT7582325.1 methionine gamma-lyase [Kordiimonadaceae bacterium]